MQILINALLTVNVIVCLLIILVVLMQRPRNEGLGAAFGGGVTENMFGAQTTNVLAKITWWLGGIFCVLTLLLSFLLTRQTTARSAIDAQLRKSAPPAAIATPAPLPPGATPAVEGAVTPTPDASAVPPSGGVVPAPVDGAPVPAPAAETPAAPAPAPAPAPAK